MHVPNLHLTYFYIDFWKPPEIKSREERSQQFFGGTSSNKGWDYDDWTGGGNSQTETTPRVMSQQQLMLQEENTSFVEQREKEIQNVVRSIYELNSIFKVN